MNFIKFEKYDVVCVSGTFEFRTNVIQWPEPLRVEDVREDSDWDNRIGDVGNSNRYLCKPLISKGVASWYKQSELTAWKNSEEYVYKALDKLMKDLNIEIY